jgi:Domain of unknown function (DUF4249)
MKNNTFMQKINFLLLIGCLAISSCIDQIEIDTPAEEPRVVVDGTFTDQWEEQIIRLSYSNEVDKQTFTAITGAQVFVEDQDGFRISFADQNDGSYSTENRATPGRQYRLVATLPDGTTLTSNLQAVPNSFPIDDVITNDSFVTVPNEFGYPVKITSAEFYAKGAVPFVSKDFYLRFRYNTVYQVTEIICNPLQTVTPICYIYNDSRPTDVNLLEIKQSDSPKEYTSFVYRRRVGTEFGEVFALDLSLYNYNPSEYAYWKQMKGIFEQQGNVTDVIPARLSGNITASDGSEVFGQFAVVGKSGYIEIVRASDFDLYVALPVCGLPGIRPWPLPEACCNCLVLPFSSLEKPDYWP